MEDRNYEEHEKIFDKMGELTVVVAVLSNEMVGLKATVEKTCDSIVELKDSLASDSAKQANKVTDKLLGMLKYVLVALLAGGVAGGTIQAYGGESHAKAPTEIVKVSK